MKRTIGILVTLGFGALALAGCMMTSTHEGILKKTNDEHAAAMEKMTKDRDNEKGMKEGCEGKLKLEIGSKNKLSAELAAKGMQIDQLLNEKGALTKERQDLSSEQQRLAKQIEELARMKEAAEKRTALRAGMTGPPTEADRARMTAFREEMTAMQMKIDEHRQAIRAMLTDEQQTLFDALPAAQLMTPRQRPPQ